MDDTEGAGVAQLSVEAVGHRPKDQREVARRVTVGDRSEPAGGEEPGGEQLAEKRQRGGAGRGRARRPRGGPLDPDQETHRPPCRYSGSKLGRRPSTGGSRRRAPRGRREQSAAPYAGSGGPFEIGGPGQAAGPGAVRAFGQSEVELDPFSRRRAHLRNTCGECAGPPSSTSPGLPHGPRDAHERPARPSRRSRVVNRGCRPRTEAWLESSRSVSFTVGGNTTDGAEQVPLQEPADPRRAP